MKPTGAEFAQAAMQIAAKGYSYKDMDCQAFMEAALKKVGIYKNWRGSNHMWREALSWHGSVEECMQKYGEIPIGAWIFTVKNDGGEKSRGYNDSMGNAAHVGCYTGQGKGAVHSTTGGTQECAFPDAKRWTHVGLCSLLDYSTEYVPTVGESIKAGLHQISNIVEALLRELS